MYRAYCTECQAFCHGRGRARYLTYWVAKHGAVVAGQRHIQSHDFTKQQRAQGYSIAGPYSSHRLPIATMKQDYEVLQDISA